MVRRRAGDRRRRTGRDRDAAALRYRARPTSGGRRRPRRSAGSPPTSARTARSPIATTATTASRADDYNWVRHAGVLLSLEQAVTAGFDAAASRGRSRPRSGARAGERGRRRRRPARRDGADRGRHRPARRRAGRTRPSIAARGRPTTICSRALGRYLVAQVQPDGRVDEYSDPVTLAPERGTPSIFTTSEVAFALARLERLFPGEGFGDPVRTITDYVTTRRALDAHVVPDLGDHWMSYALSEVVRWPDPAARASRPSELAWARKQMGIVGVMTRYESQRSDGVGRPLAPRGHVDQVGGRHPRRGPERVGDGRLRRTRTAPAARQRDDHDAVQRRAARGASGRARPTRRPPTRRRSTGRGSGTASPRWTTSSTGCRRWCWRSSAPTRRAAGGGILPRRAPVPALAVADGPRRLRRPQPAAPRARRPSPRRPDPDPAARGRRVHTSRASRRQVSPARSRSACWGSPADGCGARWGCRSRSG